MKNKVFWALVATLLFFVGCSKEQDLYDKVNDLDSRVTALEKTVNELNNITIPGLQSIVAAIQGNIYVTSVTPTTDGYSILFSNGTTAVIRNGIDGIDGEDGEKGDKGDTGASPVISVVEEEGVFYWAINGTVVTDESGKPVPVQAATPQLRINDGKWQVSYDGGTTWADVEVLGNPGGSTVSIVDGDTTVTFIINGETYVIQKELPFYLVFDARKDLGVPQGEEFYFEYTIQGTNDGDEVEVDILNCTAGWEAKVMSLPTASAPGYIAVKNVDNVDGKVFVYASNGKGKTDIKSLIFEGGVLTADADVQTITSTGGDITLAVTTNMEYELYIDRTQTWITEVPATKATHTETITLRCEPNETNKFRSAEVDLIIQNGAAPVVYIILQYPSATEATDIASLSKVQDGRTVSLVKQVVVASSMASAVVTDGENYVSVKGLSEPLAVGKEITLDGVKASDESRNAYIQYTSHTVTEQAVEFEHPVNEYIGIVPSASQPTYLAVSGLLQKDDEYYISAPMGQKVVIEAPVPELGFENKLGKYVSVYGYVVSSTTEEGAEAETDVVVATSATNIDFVEKAAWSLSYSYERGEQYPEVITNTVSGSNAPYILAVYTEEAYNELGSDPAVGAALMLSDDLQYYYYLYGEYYQMSREDIYGILVYTETASEGFSELEYGKYVAVAAGLNLDGTPTGDYKTLEFEKVKPVSTAVYSDFIGKWNMGGTVLEVSANVEGSSYFITGLPNQASYGLSPVNAQFADGYLVVSEHKTEDVWNNSNYGDCDIYLTASFVSNSKSYGAYPFNTDEPAVIFTAGKYEDTPADAFTVEAGSCEYGAFIDFGFSWVIQSGDNAGKGNRWSRVTLADMTKVEDASAEYKAWLGNYTLSTKSLKTGKDTTYNVALAAGVPNETILVDGLGVDGFPLQYVPETDKCEVVYGKFEASSSYDFYVSGITNENYVCTGDANGRIAVLTKAADKTVSIENVVYAISEERPEVYATYWGILGKKLSTGGWVTFGDVNYIVNPATMTPAASSSSLKSVAAPQAATTVEMSKDIYRACERIENAKFNAKTVDARIAKCGRKAAIELAK